MTQLVTHQSQRKTHVLRCRNNRFPGQHGFTMIELVFAISIVLVMIGLCGTLFFQLQDRARASRSIANLRQLALANLTYCADNKGQFCPAQDRRNRKRWHGERGSSSGSFDPTKGYLAPYLGGDGRVKTCPLLKDVMDKAEGSWEAGTGGYGYNAAYIGGSYATSGKYYVPEYLANIPHPARTVMFTTSAFARGERVQEYPYTEPYYSVRKSGQYGGPLQPSTHFRAAGKALVAWCDGHVTAEPPNEDLVGENFYEGDNEEELLGWFGPKERNGYWNPNAVRRVFR